jgi:hypothetical protein
MMDMLGTIGSFALAVLVLIVSTSLLWLLSQLAVGKQTFKFEFGAALLPVIVGIVLFYFWGWKSVGIVLAVFFGLWVISGLWERFTAGGSRSAPERFADEHKYEKITAQAANKEKDESHGAQKPAMRVTAPPQKASLGRQHLPATVILSEAPRVDVYMDWLSLRGPDPGKVLGFVTRGLAGFGQQELVFCIKQVSSENVRTVMTFLRTVMQLAVQGRRVDVGGLTEFGQGGIFGQSAYSGIGYAHPHSVDLLLQAAGLSSQQCILAMVLAREELMACRKFGLARVLARLGEAARFFPYPVWNNIMRNSVLAEAELTKSAFSDSGISQLPGLHVLREGDTVTVHIARQSREMLSQGLDQHDALVIATELVPGSADGVLVWHPGAAHPVAITARLFAVGAGGLSDDKTLKRLAGCFAALSLSPDGRHGASLVEDGFAILLSAPEWAGFKNAMQAGDSFMSAGKDGLLDFCTVWHG